MTCDDGSLAEDSTRRMVVPALKQKFELLADYLNLGRTVTALADGLGIPRKTISDAAREGGCTKRLHDALQKHIGDRGVRFDPNWREWRSGTHKDLVVRLRIENEGTQLRKSVMSFADKGATDLLPVASTDDDDVEVTLDRPYDEFSEYEEEKLLQVVRALLKRGGTIRIKSKKPGSVKLTISLSEDEFHRLGELLEDGELDELKVVEIKSSYGSYRAKRPGGRRSIRSGEALSAGGFVSARHASRNEPEWVSPSLEPELSIPAARPSTAQDFDVTIVARRRAWFTTVMLGRRWRHGLFLVAFVAAAALLGKVAAGVLYAILSMLPSP